MNLDDDDVTLVPGFFRSIRNMIPRSGGLSKAAGGQNVPGTLLLTNPSLPAGTNTVTGTYEDRQNNRTFYFCQNTNSNHSLWYFNPNTNVHTLVFMGSSMDPVGVSSVSSIDDILMWANGGEPRTIVVSDAVAGRYTNASFSLMTSLQKENPSYPPTVSRVTDPSISVNNVCSDSYQFSYRIIYRDESVSFFSPWSRLVKADTIPNINSATLNVISVYLDYIQPSITGIGKTIQWAYMKNGDGRAYVFSESAIDPNVGMYAVAFKNTETSTAVDPSELDKVNFIPQSTKNILVNNQRAIVTMDQFDTNFEDSGSSSLFVTATSAGSDPKVHQHGCTYTYGIVYFDSRMRTNGVAAKVDITFPLTFGSGSSGIQLSQNLHAQWSITGSPPSWASYYCIVRKKNSTVSTVFQVPAIALFYKREGDTVDGPELLDDGKIFYDKKSDVPSISSYSGQIFWKIPINIPSSLDESYIVRMLPSNGQTKTERVISIYGDKVVTGNFGITNWSSTAQNMCIPMLQFEKRAEAPSENFFEVGSIYSISGGAHSTTSGILAGDHFIISMEGFVFEASEQGSVSYSFTIGTNPPAQGYSGGQILSMSPTTSSATRDLETVERRSMRLFGLAEGRTTAAVRDFGENQRDDEDGFKVGDVKVNVTTAKRTFAVDHSKSCSDNGRSWIELRNKGTAEEKTTLSISDKYVLNSNINGMSMFKNLFTLPTDRTPIRKLINIGSSGIFLAIHERTVTALAPYSGDRFAPTSDGGQIQDALNTRSIIAYENELNGGYGTIYPDSVVEHGGRVWFFDPYKGEVCRYAANGIVPIGSIYKMASFFRDKGRVFIDPTNRNVIGGYDPVLNMYLLTFKSNNPAEEATVGFIDKQGEERWFAFYDFVPDRYVKINNRLFSFTDSGMWEHGVGSTYNNFHGSQYDSSLTGVMNMEPSQEKLLRSVYTESGSAWGFPAITSYRAGRTTQETLLVPAAFRRRGNEFSADVKRNKFSPGLGIGAAMARGELMIGRNFTFYMSNSDTELSELYFVNLLYQASPGRH